MSTPSVICPSNISEVKHATQNLTTEIAISFKSSHRLAKKETHCHTLYRYCKDTYFHKISKNASSVIVVLYA